MKVLKIVCDKCGAENQLREYTTVGGYNCLKGKSGWNEQYCPNCLKELNKLKDEATKKFLMFNKEK